MKKIREYIIGTKEQKESWRESKRRAKRLPHDYRVVYDTASKYMLNFSSNDNSVVALLPEILDLFEASIADNKDVLDVVGHDVMAFCDALLEDAETWNGKMRKKMNDDLHKKLGR